MKAIAERFSDWRRERRIRRLRALVVAHVNNGRPDSARSAMRSMTAEIEARSPGQVRRMEQGRGIGRA